MNIALTGGIASGKSCVTRSLGNICAAQIFDADTICFELLLKNRPGWHGLCQKWGDRFLDPKGDVDRIALRKAVFSDMKTRHDLENILHPLVRNQIRSIAKDGRRNRELLFFEIPLLFEVGWQGDFDWVITVFAERQERLERICKRDSLSMEEAERIIAAQMDIDKKVELSDSVIDNSGLWVNTWLQISQISHFLLAQDAKPFI